jgi:HSP20 family molecular chaperone IbpA
MSLFNTLNPTFNRASGRSAADAAAPAGRKPRYEIQETKEAYSLTVHLPGVAKDGLELTAVGEQLRVVGRPAWKRPDTWTALHRESVDTPYELVLAHDNVINVDQIQAELADGVLRVTLPKSEALKPRKIAVS